MIVVESGGSKSSWVFSNGQAERNHFESVGLHPRELSAIKKEAISQLIHEHDLAGQSIYFYGAGCESDEAKKVISDFLSSFSLNVKDVQTDLYAACIAHLGDRPGFVGILGTGAVAAQFDGERVVRYTSGLGYMLGDEGGGYDIGKTLLQYYFYDLLPAEIRTEIETYFDHEPILHTIHAPGGRKLVAGLTKIVHSYRSKPCIQEILENSFSNYCKKALQHLPINSPVYFVGGIAFYFRKEIQEVLQQYDYQIGGVSKEAVNDVFEFISNKNRQRT